MPWYLWVSIGVCCGLAGLVVGGLAMFAYIVYDRRKKR